MSDSLDEIIVAQIRAADMLSHRIKFEGRSFGLSTIVQEDAVVGFSGRLNSYSGFRYRES